MSYTETWGQCKASKAFDLETRLQQIGIQPHADASLQDICWRQDLGRAAWEVQIAGRWPRCNTMGPFTLVLCFQWDLCMLFVLCLLKLHCTLLWIHNLSNVYPQLSPLFHWLGLLCVGPPLGSLPWPSSSRHCPPKRSSSVSKTMRISWSFPMPTCTENAVKALTFAAEKCSTNTFIKVLLKKQPSKAGCWLGL